MDELKRKADEASRELRETLASNSSLRRKDFELHMRRLLDPQRWREQQLKVQLHHVSELQAKLTSKINEALRGADQRQVDDLKSEMEHELDELKRVLATLKQEQALIAEKLRALADKGPSVTISDLKRVVGC
jgi:hypothetical protein